jgi:hypothetical protein
MRCLERNKCIFYFSSFADKVGIADEYGNRTGEYAVLYSNPTKLSGNVSAAMGEMQNRQFGESELYDKVIVLDNPKVGIDEYSILWVDTLPVINEDGSTDTPHDYIVKKIARSLKCVSIAISKVTVSG